MTPHADLDRLARCVGLRVAGVLQPMPEDGLPAGIRTIALLSPDEPGYWDRLRAAPEWRDGTPDPVDRWSRRVIGGIAAELGGQAVFPFGGAPYWPFYSWALRSGRAFAAPVGLLMDGVAGLFASYRGAVLLSEAMSASAAVPPCNSCAERPCLSACPAKALTGAGYDVPACHAFLDRPEGEDCLTLGCQVRRACPVGAGRRPPEQSAYHMRRFHEVPCDA